MNGKTPLAVDLVTHNLGRAATGIGRYTRELFAHLAPHIAVRFTQPVYPPLSRHIDPLAYFPLGVKDHRAGSILHFVEDFGCSQMLWHPMRPAVATSHDLGFLAWPPEAGMHRALDRLLLRLSYLGLKRMDAVITVSEYSRQCVIRHLQVPAERVFAVHSGNNHRHFQPMPGARQKLAECFGIPDGPGIKNLLYVGAEYPRKNLGAILQVLKALPNNVRLLKVGRPGGERFRTSTRQKMAELGLADRVIFVDEVPEASLPVFYNAADAYLCASFLEGFGHPVLEALACGTPVICSNAASLPEITGDAALLVPPEDVRAMTAAVAAVLTDRSLAEQLRAGGPARAAQFTWDQTARRVIEVYQWVARNQS